MSESINQKASLFVLGSFVVACSAKVARFPEPGESLKAEAMVVEAGGKGFNLMAGARRLGANVEGLLAIGNDTFAQLAAPALARADLSQRMLRSYQAATGSGIGFTDATGETCLAVNAGANLLLSAVDVRAAADEVKRSAYVLAQFEIGDAPIVEAFALARSAGATTILNPSPFRMPSAKIMANTSIMVVNAVEAAALSEGLGTAIGGRFRDESDALEIAATALFARGPRMLIVTLGARGAVAFRSGESRLLQPAFAVEAIDTLGAGDAFTATLAVGLLESRPFFECLRRAAAGGALATAKLGVFDALATRAELDGFLAINP